MTCTHESPDIVSYASEQGPLVFGSPTYSVDCVSHLTLDHGTTVSTCDLRLYVSLSKKNFILPLLNPEVFTLEVSILAGSIFLTGMNASIFSLSWMST